MTALKWLAWLEHSTGVKIQHAGNGGEVKIRPYKVDGFDPVTNTVYEFYGCVYHGCPKCFPKCDKKVPMF